MNTVLIDMKKCTGCRACEHICTSGAITMSRDEEGFLFPQIAPSKCTDCGLCALTCPTENKVQVRRPLETYAAVHKDKKILSDSSSGGVFTALADIVLENHGTVVGCMLNGAFRAVQTAVSDPKLIPGFRGSKYVQSDTGTTYRDVEKLLKNGTCVLYTGTPCQIAGLKKYLGKEYDTLLTADLVCHGVPSPELFIAHIRWLEEKSGQKISEYRFRCKTADASSVYCYKYKFDPTQKNITGPAVLDPYYFAFLKAATYRECCYGCPYAQENRVGDITFADYWNAEELHPELSGINGVSMLTLNTPKALLYKPEISKRLELIPTNTEWMLERNLNLNRPARRPEERDTIYKEIQTNGYGKWADKFCSRPKWILRNAFEHLPVHLRTFLTRLLKN